MRNQTRVIVMVLAVTLGLALAGVAWAAEPLVLGTVYGMTGPLGWIGDEAIKGAELRVEEINKAGGVNGQPLKLVKYDSEDKAEKAVVQVKKLIQSDKAVAILGPTPTGPSLAVLPIVNEMKIPTFVVSGGIPINARILPRALERKERTYLFALSIGTRIQNEMKVLHMKRRGVKTFANIEPATEIGEISAEQYEMVARKHGLQLLGREKYDPTGTDFTPQLAKLKALRPEALGTMASGKDAAILAKNFHQLGFNIPFYISDANISPRFISLLGDATANLYAAGVKTVVGLAELADTDPQKAVIRAFRERYEAKYGKTDKSMFFEGVGYDSVSLAAEAIRAVGTSGEKLLDYLEALKGFQGVNGVYSFSSGNHRGYGPDQLVIVTIRGNKWVVTE